MKTKKLSNQIYLLKLEKGEEIVKTLNEFCRKEKIKSGFLLGIGAAKKIKVGFFDLKKKKYLSKEFKKYFEIVSLIGNISELKGEIFLHLHIIFCDENFKCFGGHLISGTVSATLELRLETTKTKISRSFDRNLSLNLLKI